MNNAQPQTKTFFGIFKFGAKERTFEGDLPLWEYFVKIKASSGLEAIRLMTVNFGAMFERIFTEEQFTEDIESFYARGVYCELTTRKEMYYVLASEAFEYAANHGLALPPNWERMIRFKGSAEECCDKINQNTTFDLTNKNDLGLCVVSDGERVLIEWLRFTSQTKTSWIAQKF